ncbi:MAG TPA: type II toxin-antitoxin system PemK/MazF family toxin [Jiangellaceae bacterium]|nr:type II toxin-antitoxin system PemK/MazF family toxin [Jiangellaceae bacterium]
MTISQGQIWLAAFSPTVGHEQSGTRPCIVVSGRRFNAMPIQLALVVPITSRNRNLPHHVRVSDDGSLNRASWAMCEAVRSISTDRLRSQIGTADDETVAEILSQLSLWFDA